MPHYQMNSSEQLCAVPITPVSSTNKTARHDIAEILLKVALNTITLTTIFWMESAVVGYIIKTRSPNDHTSNVLCTFIPVITFLNSLYSCQHFDGHCLLLYQGQQCAYYGIITIIYKYSCTIIQARRHSRVPLFVVKR